mmetsp:Transcript_38313/g.86010  ORF Transcript_38313/g.86010 Transcript_38313/m.86010 type:complete len:203 (-) Transcript_38313:2-610(-)
MVWMSLLMISSLANAADREGEWSPALRCGVCRFIAENIGATVSKRVRAGLSHERKRARAQTCMESRKACSEIYIGPNLGLRKAGADAVEIVEDAVVRQSSSDSQIGGCSVSLVELASASVGQRNWGRLPEALTAKFGWTTSCNDPCVRIARCCMQNTSCFSSNSLFRRCWCGAGNAEQVCQENPDADDWGSSCRTAGLRSEL